MRHHIVVYHLKKMENEDINSSKRKVSRPNPSCSNHKSDFKAVVLLLIICLSFLLLGQYPKAFSNDTPSKLLQIDRLHDPPQLGYTTYLSSSVIPWSQLSIMLQNLKKTTELRQVGLLNFGNKEIEQWHQMISNGTQISTIHLRPASSNITWETVYPGWIDEEEEREVPTCPNLPEPEVPKGVSFDLVAVKLPCSRSTNDRSRDIARLHLQLAAARVVASRHGNHEATRVLLLSECFPLMNLFRLKKLEVRVGSVWLYMEDVEELRKKVQLPIGSCALTVPINSTAARLGPANSRREAYVTILHSAPKYLCGAIVTGKSIRRTGSTRELVVLVDRSISAGHRSALAAAGWTVRSIDRIRNPKLTHHTYNEFNYSKLRLWQLTDYDVIVFVDADVLVLRNIDFLFEYPEITAAGNHKTVFNSGVMVVEPSERTFEFMMDHIREIDSYNGGDQGFLNEVFPWWHRVWRGLNLLKHFEDGRRSEKEGLLREAHAVHYLGMKPWWCYRDYDCNWNMDNASRVFASDAMNEEWWRIHDTVPRRLRRFCELTTEEKAELEWHRRQAEKANYTDGHWRWKIKDARRMTCGDKTSVISSLLS